MTERPDLEQQARAYMHSVAEAADKLGMTERPYVGTSFGADGSVTVEWILSGRRAGLAIETEPLESGWWFVTREGEPRDGGLDSFDAELLVQLMNRHVTETDDEEAVLDGATTGRGRDIRLGPLCAHVSSGRFWLRLWERGPGVAAKDTSRWQLLFSERNGRGVMVGRWLVKRLRRERSWR